VVHRRADGYASPRSGADPLLGEENAMVLTRAEERRLRVIARGCWATDPEWAGRLGGSHRSARRRALIRWSTHVLALVLIAVGAGAAVFPLLFLGILAGTAAACLDVTARGRVERG
jgi:hypothetical protein